jgi:hypothetical protein
MWPEIEYNLKLVEGHDVDGLDVLGLSIPAQQQKHHVNVRHAKDLPAELLQHLYQAEGSSCPE